MKLKLLSLLLILGMMVQVGCTSSNDESTDVEAADASESQLEGEESADVDAEEGEEVVEGEEEVTEEVAEGEEAPAEGEEVAEETDDFAGDEEVVADTGDEEVAAEGAAEESAPSTDVAASEELPAESLEDAGDSSEIIAEDGTGTEGTELADGSVSDTPPPAEEGVFDSAASESPAVSEPTPSYDEAPKMIPVKKIADAPFKKNGMLLNTVYIARPGDDLGSISQKIFGSDQTATLTQANPNLANGVKTGDKVYYNSPKRPADGDRMLTYYEDSGIPAQSYVAKAGDNIRTISKNLLGNQSSWKEVWATNMAVESKDELAEGTELRYWPEGSAGTPAAPVMADATPPPPAPETPQMPEPVPDAPVAANDPSQPAVPQDDFALPDDMANGAAAGTVAAEPPPPPPPPPAAPQKSVASNDEKDLTFMLSAGGLLLVGVGVLLGIIRKGRSRKMSMNTHTQI